MSVGYTTGLIGTGAMGTRMGANLRKAGCALVVHDLDRKAAEAFAAAHGAEVAADLADLGRRAEVVITMLPTGADVRQVLLEAEGGALAEALAPGAVVIDMSSSEPVGTRELAGILAARGITLIDAPVSGGTVGAEAGTLTIMIGGEDEAAIAKVTPLLEIMGENLFRVGPVGAGHAMKSLNNFVSSANYSAGVEALLIGQAFGLDPATIIDVINVSTGRNNATQGNIKTKVLPRTFDLSFKLGLMAKDVKIAADLGEQLGLDLPVSRMIRDIYQEGREMIDPDLDVTQMIRRWEIKNNMEVRAVPKPAND